MPLRISLSLILLGTALIAGCRPAAQTPGDTLIYGQAEDPSTLDPINTDIAEAVHVMTNVYDTLVTYDDKTTDIVPSLAEKWTTSEDGKTWTFSLRPGVKFHNGDEFDSAAVKLTFERLLQDEHPLVFDSARPYKPAYEMIKSIETLDARTVVFQLKQPSAVFLANLAMFPASIVSPRALEESKADFAERPIGTGPFQFVKWARDQQLLLESFDQHWRGAPKIKRLVFVPVKESATRAQRLERGEIHVGESLSPTELDRLARSAKVKIEEQIGMNVAYLSMHNEKPPLDNKKVREAIYLAIDKQKLIDVGYAGHAQPAVSMVPPSMWGHVGDLHDRPYDPQQARALLAEAAEEAGFELPLRLNLSIMNQARTYLPQPLSTAGFLRDSLAAIGIEVNIVGRDANQHFEHLERGEHELGLAGWNSDNSDPDNFLYTLLDIDNIAERGNNVGRWRNERFHELMLAGREETDLEKRLPLYLEAQKIVLDEAPIVPLVHTNLRTAMSRDLQGYQLHPTGMVRLRQAHFGAPQ
jgi:peptide/nickel transport system substrate-binding protein